MILLTGASGFIGKNLHARLLEEGIEVYALSRSDTKLPSVRVDITDQSALDRIPWHKISKVVHLAAAGVKASGRDWQACVETNIGGTINLLSYIEKFNLPFIVGKSFYEELTDEQPKLKRNPYILTKKYSSEIIREFSKRHEESTVLVNIFQCYGVGDDDNNVLNYTLKQLKSDEIAELGPCNSERDWIHIEDVVSLILKLIEEKLSPKLLEYDAGSGKVSKIKEVVTILAENLSKEHLLNFSELDKRGDQGISVSAENSLPGWAPKISLIEGLGKVIKYTN